jgi:ADP-ribose pyrophosphatase
VTDLSWETLSESVAYTCDGFDIINQSVQLPDGTETEFDYISETESVVVLPFRGDGEVVVIEEWRQAVDRVNRGLPAGSLEPGEHPSDGVNRELREETGYEAETVRHLTTVEPANGFANSVFHYFVAEGCSRAGGQSLDTDESISVSTASFESLIDAVEDGSLRDGRSAFGICYYGLFEA